MSLASSWAYSVDTSPPIAGHVYDGASSNPTARKDIDFQTDMSALKAFWEGFHDPHTSIKEFYVSVGTCPECEDVIARQAVGIVYGKYVINEYVESQISYLLMVGWLVVFLINVDLAIFQPYLDLEAGDNQSLKIQVARRGIEPRSSCSASQELNHSATAAPIYLLKCQVENTWDQTWPKLSR